MGQAEKAAELAIKIHEAILATLTEKEKQDWPMLDESMWLVMQMICGPNRAAEVISQSQIYRR